MRKATGQLFISIDIKCPHCSSSIDLFDSNYCDDKEEIMKTIKSTDWNNVNLGVLCPDCDEAFLFNKVELP